MKVCFFSTYYTSTYPREQVFLEGLKQNNVELFEIHEHGKNPFRYFKALWKLFINQNKFDVVLVNFRGHEIIPFIYLICRKPIVFDALVSAYNTAYEDRGWFKEKSIKGKLVYWLEKFDCKNSDLILVDGPEHKKYFEKIYGLEKTKVKYLYNGAHSFFTPQKENKSKEFSVIWYGSYILSHGLDKCIDAAEILKNENEIMFYFVGDGIEKKKIVEKAMKLKLSNVKFIDFVPHKKLIKLISSSKVGLTGPFGDTEKAQKSVVIKSFQCMAMKKPIIVSDTISNRNIFRHKENSLFVKSPKDIANAIILLKNDKSLRKKIAENGYKLFKEKYSQKHIGKQLKEILEQTCI